MEENNNDLDEMNVDELLSSTQGDDQTTIDSHKKETPDSNKGGADDIEDKGSGGVDDDKGSSGTDEGEGNEEDKLSQEDFNTVSSEVNQTLGSFTDDASEETKAIKKSMLDLFEGAVDFDQHGNLVNDKGEQVGTYEELVNKIGTEKDAIFDAVGNLVDTEGKIITSKNQLEVDSSEVNSIGKELGYEFDDGTGGIKLYKEGNEGLKELTDDIAEYKLNEFRNTFFNSNPVLREVSKHLIAGGRLEDFDKPVDYEGVKVEEMSLEGKKAVIKQSFIAEGMSATRAEKLTAGLEDGAETDKEVQESLEVLTSKQELQQQARQETLNQQAQKEANDNKVYWNDVNTRITKGDLDGFTIPEASREEFFRYLAIPVKDGQSQDQLDRVERTLEQELKESFYRFKGYDVSDIVSEGEGKANVRSLRQRMKKTKELALSHKPHVKGSTQEISVDNIH